MIPVIANVVKRFRTNIAFIWGLFVRVVRVLVFKKGDEPRRGVTRRGVFVFLQEVSAAVVVVRGVSGVVSRSLTNQSSCPIPAQVQWIF